ncbi:MAG: glycosyltransferase, partial [Candidatus Riflebacteria bacterium]|nr:glycosyltransferase [Candidatus Riflebacteria bacterium]
VLGLGGVAGNAFARSPAAPPAPSPYAHVPREVSAVTGACMMVRRDCWDLVGGFDEENLAVAFNDVDFCLRLWQAGRRVLYTPHARLLHFESFSRGKELDLKEVEYMRRRWAREIAGDRFYNPNLTRDRADFSVAISRPPR